MWETHCRVYFYRTRVEERGRPGALTTAGASLRVTDPPSQLLRGTAFGVPAALELT